MRADPTVTDVRVFPLIEVSRQELAEVVGGTITSIEPANGGLTNTIHKVAVDTGETFGVKHYAGGRDWFETELTTLTLLHGTLPVPEVVHVDDRRQVIVYRWIEGITLHELRTKGQPDAFASLAEPLGRVLAYLARTDATEAFELTEVLERTYALLSRGRARDRIGPSAADALRKAMEAAEPQLAWGTVCLSHGDLGHRNVIVNRSGERWRINGVIDWETTTTSSPLFDIGSVFRYADRHDAVFLDGFARGYREAGGDLPGSWFLASRMLDATCMVELLAEDQDLPTVFSDCRRLIVRLIADVEAEALGR